MKAVFVSMALSATAASLASAFIGSPLPLRALSRSPCAAHTCRIRPSRMAADEAADEAVDENGNPKVFYASEVTDGNERTKFTEEFGDQPLLAEDTTAKETERFGPVDYNGFVDGDGFDGGDGQVGVVGDGSNAMEEFDQKSVGLKRDMQAKLKQSTMVKESKARQRNAWGSGNTGYAEKLKNEGMVKVNLKGEDISKIRRQQFENWRNQQEITAAQRAKVQEMDRISSVTDEVDDTHTWKKGKESYFSQISKGDPEKKGEDWNKYSAPVTTGKKDGTDWADTSLTGKEKVEATIQVISQSGRPGHGSIEVKNTVMTFEPFHCTFVGDTNGFAVSPAEGTLNRRGGEATVLDVSYKGQGPADNRVGTLVVETEEDKWVYKIEGAMQ